MIAPEVGVSAVQHDSSDSDEPLVIRTVEYAPTRIPYRLLLVDGRPRLPSFTDARDRRRRVLDIRIVGDHVEAVPFGYVGLLRLGDRIVLEVAPRFPLADLEHLLRRSGELPLRLPDPRRSYELSRSSPQWLADFLARDLLAALEAVEVHGIHRDYVQRVEDTSLPRGRLLLRESLNRHLARGVTHRVVVSRFERTADIPTNRCLRYAVERVALAYASLPEHRQDGDVRTRLNRFALLFASATMDRARRFLDDALVANPARLPYIRSYYAPALRIASAIARDMTPRTDALGRDLELSSLVVNVGSVFEAYVREVLRDQLASHAPDVLVLDGNKAGDGGGQKLLFDQAAVESDEEEAEGIGQPAEPDVVIVSRGASALTGAFLVDAKYKVRPSSDDVHQAISYATSFRSTRIVLVHPLSPGVSAGLHPIGRLGSVAVYRYALDLGNPDVLDEESRFGSRVARLMKSSSQSGPL